MPSTSTSATSYPGQELGLSRPQARLIALARALATLDASVQAALASGEPMSPRLASRLASLGWRGPRQCAAALQGAAPAIRAVLGSLEGSDSALADAALREAAARALTSLDSALAALRRQAPAIVAA